MIKDVSDLHPFVRFLVQHLRAEIFILLAALYVVAFTCIKVRNSENDQIPVLASEPQVVKLVDVQEYIPQPPKQVVQVEQQPVASEIIQEVDEIEEKQEKETNFVEENQAVFSGMNGDDWSNYRSQAKITEVPVIPTKEVLSKIVYPSLAYKQGIEGVVYLELYIDDEGNIRKIEVLKDPGHGFAEAALSAFEGIKCQPATANGQKVPVRFRYPVRFKIK